MSQRENRMGILDFFKRKKRITEFENSDPQILVKPSRTSSDLPTEPRLPPYIPKDIPYLEKERILVEYITIADILQFSDLPYDFSCTMHKETRERFHPFAYFDINLKNQVIAKEHLNQLNAKIASYRHLIPSLSSDFYIDTEEIVFQPYETEYGSPRYSQLICEPYTTDGTVSLCPLSLSFTTRQDVYEYETHGTVSFNQHGKIQKAEINIWRNPTLAQGKGIGWFFTFRTFDSGLELYEAKTNLKRDIYGQALAVYKHPSIIEWERQRAQDLENYQWIQSHLPTMCPKSISGFRRMKTMNTKNYQKLVAEAAKLGKSL